MYEYRARLSRVVDGDTVDVDIDLGFDMWAKNKRVRLDMVDTPEKRTRDLLEKHFGNLATDFVNSKLMYAKKIIVRTKLDGGSDKYGRILGEFWIDDEPTSLNEQLFENRYAVKYEGQAKTAVAEAHINNYKYLVINGLTTLPEELVPLYEKL